MDKLSPQHRTSHPVLCGLMASRLRGVRKRSTPASFRREFCERVRAARVTSSKTAQEVAEYLGVPKDTYLRWESRALLPHHLIAPFCEITRTDIYRLLTGEPFDLGEAIALMRHPKRS